MTISAAQVKQLRDKTGAGMMDAKKALVETNGDMEAALDWLRTKGIAKAAKKAGRTAAEGAVVVKTEGTKASMVEVNSETDFAAKNDKFKDFAAKMADLVLQTGVAEQEELMKQTLDGATVAEKQTEMVATIGENISVRRAAVMQADGVVGAYVHMGGKIGVLVGLSGSSDAEVAKQIAMHIAASNPQFLDRTAIDPDVLAREKTIYTEQANASGKPANVVEKIVEGRLNKFAEEICLVDQAFVMDPDRKVGEVAKAAGATITGFVRFGLGEGIEKEESDFAAEVAAAVNA